MQLAVGTSVVHPLHGVGQVVGIENQELVEGFEQYYVLKIPDKRLTTHIPMRRIEKVGIRPVMTKSQVNKVLDVLGDEPNQLPKNLKERRVVVEKKLKNCAPIPMAEIVRDLTWQKHVDRLTKPDTDLLNRAHTLLVSEMAMATDTKPTEVEKRIKKTLNATLKAKLAVS